VERRLASFAASILSLFVAVYDPAFASCVGFATPSGDDGLFAPFVGNSNLAVEVPSEEFAGMILSPIPGPRSADSQIADGPGPGPIIMHDPGPNGDLLGPTIVHDPGPNDGFLGPIIIYDPGPVGDVLGTQFVYDPAISPNVLLAPTPAPAALPLLAGALGILGFLSYRRKFIAAI
jgi:hypothetical protein